VLSAIGARLPGLPSRRGGRRATTADPGRAGGHPASGRWRVAGAALLFVSGFTVVFTAATVAVLGLSDVLLVNQGLLQRLGGVVTIVMGLVFLGVVPVWQRGMRVRHAPRDGLWGAPLLGAVYGLGWTPCLGPTLAGVIALAAGTQVGPTTGRGLLLIGAYCLGLGLPFGALALRTARWAVRSAGWLRRHISAVHTAGGGCCWWPSASRCSPGWGAR
jgi:cytochrome c-type biogenesis protein